MIPKLEFTARRRHDADVIFLAGHPRASRLLNPQLRFYRASRIPVYATPSIYSGRPNPSQDLDLNGIRFCDIPWLYNDVYQGELSLESLQDSWRQFPSIYLRLIALGIDANLRSVQGNLYILRKDGFVDRYGKNPYIYWSTSLIQEDLRNLPKVKHRSEYRRMYNANNSGRMREYNKQYRTKAYAILGPSVCCVCGRTDGLEIAHIDRLREEKRLLGVMLYRWVINNPEQAIKKVRILCANCNHLERGADETSYSVRKHRRAMKRLGGVCVVRGD